MIVAKPGTNGIGLEGATRPDKDGASVRGAIAKIICIMLNGEHGKCDGF